MKKYYLILLINSFANGMGTITPPPTEEKSAIPSRLDLWPLNTLLLTQKGDPARLSSYRLTSQNIENNYWNSLTPSGISTKLASDLCQQIGAWVQSQMGIPPEQQSKIYKLNTTDFGRCESTLIHVYTSERILVTRKLIFRIFINEEKLSLYPKGLLIYFLLHEAAHATHLPYWNYYLHIIEPKVETVSKSLIAIKIGHVLGKLSFPRDISAECSLLSTYDSLLNMYLSRNNEKFAEQKTLKTIRCTTCLRETCKHFRDHPSYNSRKQLTKRIEDLEKTGQEKICPFHQEEVKE